jgi:hypothetical protein
MVNPAYIPTEQEILLRKRHEAYQQKKTKEQEQRTKRCVPERYADMHSENKKARIEQITANHELKCITTCQESIAMVNPAYIAIEFFQRNTLSKLFVFDINWKI